MISILPGFPAITSPPGAQCAVYVDPTNHHSLKWLIACSIINDRYHPVPPATSLSLAKTYQTGAFIKRESTIRIATIAHRNIRIRCLKGHKDNPTPALIKASSDPLDAAAIVTTTEAKAPITACSLFRPFWNHNPTKKAKHVAP